MTEESDLTVTVGPDDVVAPQEEAKTEGQADVSQTAPPEPEGESEEKRKSVAAERRERAKAKQEQLRIEHQNLQDKLAKAEAQKQKIIAAGNGEKPPTEAEFPDFVELAAAKALWSMRRQDRADKASALDEEAAETRKQIEIRQAAERQIIEQSWQETVQIAKSRYADFEQVAFTAPISDEVAALIKTSEVGADVAYHLGQNPKKAIEISRLSPVEAAREIGRLEASLSAPKARTQTSAPDPITPVKGTGAAVGKDPDKMSYAEFKAYRESGGTIRPKS